MLAMSEIKTSLAWNNLISNWLGSCMQSCGCKWGSTEDDDNAFQAEEYYKLNYNWDGGDIHISEEEKNVVKSVSETFEKAEALIEDMKSALRKQLNDARHTMKNRLHNLGTDHGELVNLKTELECLLNMLRLPDYVPFLRCGFKISALDTKVMDQYRKLSSEPMHLQESCVQNCFNFLAADNDSVSPLYKEAGALIGEMLDLINNDVRAAGNCVAMYKKNSEQTLASLISEFSYLDEVFNQGAEFLRILGNERLAEDLDEINGKLWDLRWDARGM